MPIIISRNTDAPPVITNPLTPQQREELWANIVRSWVDRNQEAFLDMLENGVPGKIASEPRGV